MVNYAEVTDQPRFTLRKNRKLVVSVTKDMPDQSPVLNSEMALVMGHTYDTQNTFYTVGTMDGRIDRVTSHIWQKVYSRESYRTPFERSHIVGANLVPGANIPAHDDTDVIIMKDIEAARAARRAKLALARKGRSRPSDALSEEDESEEEDEEDEPDAAAQAAQSELDLPIDLPTDEEEEDPDDPNASSNCSLLAPPPATVGKGKSGGKHKTKKSMKKKTAPTGTSTDPARTSEPSPVVAPATPSVAPATPSVKGSHLRKWLLTFPSVKGSNISVAPATPSVEGSNISVAPATPSVEGSNISVAPATPSVEGSNNISVAPATPSVEGSNISVAPATPSVEGSNISLAPATPSVDGSGSNISLAPATPSVEGSIISLAPATPSVDGSGSMMSVDSASSSDHGRDGNESVLEPVSTPATREATQKELHVAKKLYNTNSRILSRLVSTHKEIYMKGFNATTVPLIFPFLMAPFNSDVEFIVVLVKALQASGAIRVK
ncbi:protein wings apart-like [Hyalella azteca]|uniref:Protein wings apart-like n=1 Tax=Hyalella azteca TaxID=294128 RepID=A0A979FQN3_HYAAZ|nr:protein wings apart-like [Hyalella azteca]